MNNKTKRKIYIALFTFLGVLLGFLFHGIVEIWYINRLTENFSAYSLGYTWQQWFVIHKYFAITTLVLGLLFGFFQGQYWWKVVYQQKRLDPFFKKLRKLLNLK